MQALIALLAGIDWNAEQMMELDNTRLNRIMYRIGQSIVFDIIVLAALYL